MKTLLTCLLLSLYFQCSSQSDLSNEVPDSVYTAFKKIYPEDEPHQWKRDINGQYLARFRKDGKPAWAVFNANGYLIRSRETADRSEIPAGVILRAGELYPEYDIDGYAIVSMTDKKSRYVVVMRRNGDERSLLFDVNHNYMGEEVQDYILPKQ